MIHTGTALGHIGKADAEIQKRAELMWCVKARRDPDFKKRRPEAVAGVGIVSANRC